LTWAFLPPPTSPGVYVPQSTSIQLSLETTPSFSAFWNACNVVDCLPGTYGTNCTKLCHCQPNVYCNTVNGLCPDDQCAYEWGGTACQICTYSRLLSESYIFTDLDDFLCRFQIDFILSLLWVTHLVVYWL